MTLADLREAARRRLADSSQPYGWATADLNAWINEAIREASLRGRISPTTATVALVAGTASYALSATIDYIHSIKLDGISLGRTTRSRLTDSFGNWESITGTPRHFFVEGRTLTVSPNPTAVGTLALAVDSIPAELTSDAQSPSLEAQDQLALLEWVIYRAGQQRDMDWTLPHPEQFEANFTRYFGPRPSTRTRRAWLEWGGTDTAMSS